MLENELQFHAASDEGRLQIKKVVEEQLPPRLQAWVSERANGVVKIVIFGYNRDAPKGEGVPSEG